MRDLIKTGCQAGAAIALALTLAACEPVAPPGAAGPVGAGSGPAEQHPDTCNAAAYQSYVGQPGSAATAAPDPKRIYGPDDIITMEYNAQRLNFQTSNDGIIHTVTCG